MAEKEFVCPIAAAAISDIAELEPQGVTHDAKALRLTLSRCVLGQYGHMMSEGDVCPAINRVP